MEGIETETLITGAPLIKGGLAYFDCRLRQAIDAGTSILFIGEVTAVKQFEGQPLFITTANMRGSLDVLAFSRSG